MANNNAKRHTNLTKRQRARELLLAGELVSKVAAELGVDYSTVYRWRRQPEFAKRMEAAQESRLKCIEDRLKNLTIKAVDYAEHALDLTNEVPHPVRAKVMADVLERAGIRGKSDVTIIAQAPPTVTPSLIEQAQKWIAENAATAKSEGPADD